jgi:hypothetical protein
MHWFSSILREIVGLFVDDGSFALIILCWVPAAALLPSLLAVPPAWHGGILFAGLAMTLVWSCLRFVRRGAI